MQPRAPALQLRITHVSSTVTLASLGPSHVRPTPPDSRVRYLPVRTHSRLDIAEALAAAISALRSPLRRRVPLIARSESGVARTAG
ncbi:hypothetical protein BV25DRAFT_1439973 [Artomyces pyxidatus]|uniref:Uncharacterized protein n=1 Tax=Artomyces pyxidatus TaxID=48021 RepID=A0ACB8SM51_9AGAM|nr:hypothetical protein BV25DRAFT_1439973 [Artomyces pyxidatus]